MKKQKMTIMHYVPFNQYKKVFLNHLNDKGPILITKLEREKILTKIPPGATNLETESQYIILKYKKIESPHFTNLVVSMFSNHRWKENSKATIYARNYKVFYGNC